MVPTRYKRINLMVDTRLIEQLKLLFRDGISIYETEDEILELVYSTHFKINRAGTELTLELKEENYVD